MTAVPRARAPRSAGAPARAGGPVLAPPRTPRRGGAALTWVYVRVSGVLLVGMVLGHLTANLVVGDGIQAVDFALVAGRYSNPYWQLWSLVMLWLAMTHGAIGLRTIIRDYAQRPATRWVLTWATYVTTAAIIALGSLVIFTFDPCPVGADPADLPGFCPS